MFSRFTSLAAASWLTLLGLSIALSALAAAHDTLPGDTGIATWVQDLPFPGETLSDIVRSVTPTELVLGAGAVLALVMWVRGRRREAIIFAVGLVILPLMQAGTKEIVDRPRPAPEVLEIRTGFDSPSFPSGHVMSSLYLYGYLIYLALRLSSHVWLRVAAAAPAAVLALSGLANVWLGVHWPSDVLGGYAWGLVLLLPVVVVAHRFGRAD